MRVIPGRRVSFLTMLGLAALLLALGCSAEVEPNAALIRARFDPDAKVIPKPTDIFRDEQAGKLDLDPEDAATAAEREFVEWLNTLDGWLSTTSATLELTGAITRDSIDAETIQVWSYGHGHPVRLDRSPSLSADGKKLTIDPPQDGWPRGSTIVIMARGGEHGLRGHLGERVDCDAAFYFVRLDRSLLEQGPDRAYRAFPGDTLEARRESAEALEEIRAQLSPYFDEFAKRGVPRDEVAALWSFTISDSTELAMDKASGRMPLPSDLLIDHRTGRVDLPVLDRDTELEAAAKQHLSGYDGFGITMNPSFEFTAPVSAATVNEDTVQLYKVAYPPQRIPVEVSLDTDLLRVNLTQQEPPFDEQATYAVVLRPGILDSAGRPIVPTAIGHFINAEEPLVVDGESQVGSLSDADAQKLERVRGELAPLLEGLGRDQVDIAWPFTTMTVLQPLRDAVNAAERVGAPADPEITRSLSPLEAVAEFVAGINALVKVKRVYEGTITSPNFLDPLQRANRSDGSFRPEELQFTLTIPSDAQADKPLPVVIFGHGLVCDRRFVLSIADVLARRGFAAIAIDFPYHGSRSACAWSGPICMPDPFSDEGKMLCPDPCPEDAQCAADGRCLYASGQPAPFKEFPVVGMIQASGAAFIEVDNIWGTRDHFAQSIVDLGSLSRTIREGDWQTAIGYQFKTDEIYYVGQSLGGILGAIYVALDPHVKKAVLNVPGSNLVKLFSESMYFESHIDAYLESQQIEKGSPEHLRFLNIARWLVDSVDPLGVARYLESEPLPDAPQIDGRGVFVQMASFDWIIPKDTTELLVKVADVPAITYPAEHAFLVVPLEPGYLPAREQAADFLTGAFVP